MPIPSPSLYPSSLLLPAPVDVPTDPTALPRTMQAMLDALPPFVASAKDVQAVVRVLSNEVDRIDAAKEVVRAQFTPQSADRLLGAWEAVLGIPVAPVGQSIEQRQATVVGYMQRLKSIATGPEWVAALTRLIGTAWSYQEYMPTALLEANLIPNPSAETNSTGWSAGSGATIARDNTGPAFSGSYAMRVTRTAVTGTASMTYAAGSGLGLVAGTRVSMSLYVRAGTVARSFSITAQITGDTVTTALVPGTSDPSGWTRVVFEDMAVPANPTNVQFFVSFLPVNAGEFHYVDGLLLSPTSKFVLPYVDGDQPGYQWLGTAHASGSRKIGNTVPANTIRVTLPYAAAIAMSAVPPTAGPTTTGGVLAAGTWHYKITAYNTFGESLATADVTAVTTGATSKVTLAWTAVVGAMGYRVYRGTSATNHTLIQDVTTNGYVDVGGQIPSAIMPPLVNTTQGFAPEQARNLARDITPAHIDLQFVYAAGFLLGVSKVGNEVL